MSGPFTPLPRPPSQRGGAIDTFELSKWFDRIWLALSNTAAIAWASINFKGSSLSDIEARKHSQLQDIQGSGSLHVSATEGETLTALDVAGVGFVAKTSASSFESRFLSGTTGEIEVTNGDGTGDDPVIGLPQLISGPRQIGTDPDYTEFEADGTPVFKGAATNWNDINKSLLPLSTGLNVPNIIAINGAVHLKVRAFNGVGTLNELGEGCEILHDYKEGSDIMPHLHWAATTSAAGNVKWQLAYMWINRNGTFTGEVVESVTVAASGVAWQEQRTNFPAISGTGKEIGSRFQFVLFRDPTDAADTYAADAAAFDFGIHYERDTIGSRQITAK